jgi:predicted phage gp36 major capsid-like protein
MLEAHIFRTYQKDLRNLALQERRLRSQLKQTTEELRQLQRERLEAAEEAAKKESAPVKPANGFEFSAPPTPATSAAVPAPEPVAPDQLNLKSEAIAA